MIRLLTQKDHATLRTYLNRDPIHNFYAIHALQACGMESEMSTFWGTFRRELQGVLFVASGSMAHFGMVTGDNPKILAELGRFAHRKGVRFLLGRQEAVISAVRYCHSYIDLIRYYVFYETHPGELKGFYHFPVRKATMEDIPLLVEHYIESDWPVYRDDNRDCVEQEIRRVMKYESGYFFIKIQDRVVSAARIVGETDRVGCIDETSTLPEFRGQNMYPCVRTACIECLFKKGKMVVEYVRDSNTAMHRVITKNGGVFKAKWVIVTLRKKPSIKERILPSFVYRNARRLKSRLFP